MTDEEIIGYAKDDAAAAIDIARASGSDPIAWITGNSYVPPLRDFGQAEEVWQADLSGDGWEVYVETFERELDAASVYLESPEYDNALYVVDLARFEYEEDEEGEMLQDDWRSRS